MWATGGLYLALVPLLIQQVFDVRSSVVNGLSIAALFGMGSVWPTLLRHLSPAAAGIAGMAVMALGAVLLLLSLLLVAASGAWVKWRPAKHRPPLMRRGVLSRAAGLAFAPAARRARLH